MKPQCIEAVSKAVGRPITSAEASGIEERISRHLRQNAARDPQATLAMSPEERLTEAARTASEELLAEASKKRQRVALQVLANSRNQAFLANYSDQLDGLDRLIAFKADSKGNTLSAESRAKAIERDALRQMVDTLEATDPTWLGVFENQESMGNLIRELFGEKTGIKQASDGAKAFRDVAETLRQRFNRGGGDIGRLDDWGMPHHHSQLRVAKAGKQQWIADTLPALDRRRYANSDGTPMNEAQLAQFLEQAWTTIATGGANKVAPGQSSGNGMRANRGSASRQIHFKDADSYMAYQGRYGEHTPYEVMVGHIRGVASDIAMVETFGPNPDHAFRYFKDQAMQAATLTDPTRSGAIEKAGTNVENLYNMVAGRTQPPASAALARGFDTLRSWLVASRLGSAVISSLSDEATMRLAARTNRLPALKLFANELAALNPANRTEKRMALRAGLAMDTLISSLNRWGNDELGSNLASKLGSVVLRASGLNALTEARRRAFGTTMMSALGQVSRDADSLAKLDADDHRLLLSKGITDADFTVWKRAELEDWGGSGRDTMLTPEAIYRIPDEKLADLGDPVTLKQEAATRLLGIVLEETNVAVIEPGARERAFMHGGTQRGTWKGELTRSFWLFKSFPIAMIARHWRRGMDQPTGSGRAAYIAALMASTTVLGMASLQINELVSGRDPRNMNPLDGGARTWIQAMLKGGSLGIYGDFLFSDATQHGQSPIASFLGPVFGMGEDLFKLTQGNLMEAAQGKDTHAAAEAVKFAKGMLPGANLWYTKAALDHMVFHQLQEHFSPGYLGNVRDRAQREFGQRFWWEPGEISPDRAPDLTAATGE